MIFSDTEFTIKGKKFVIKTDHFKSELTIIHNFFPWVTSFKSLRDASHCMITPPITQEDYKNFIYDEILSKHYLLEKELEQLSVSLNSKNKF